jgi:hypothetical protein
MTARGPRVGCFGEGDDLVGTQLVERDGQAGMSDLGGIAEPPKARCSAHPISRRC